MKQPETVPIRLLLVTEAWPPQINGVTVSYENVFRGIPRDRYAIKVISPDLESWRTWPWPFYSSVKLEFGATSRLKNEIRLFNPDCIHIATEGPLGWAARNLCLREHRPFTTAYHTKYPEYLAGYVPRGLKAVVTQLAYATLRRFHATSSAMMVASDALEEELKKHKFRNPIVRWTRGAIRRRPLHMGGVHQAVPAAFTASDTARRQTHETLFHHR